MALNFTIFQTPTKRKSGLNLSAFGIESQVTPTLTVREAPQAPTVRVVEGGGFAPLKVTEAPLQPEIRVAGALKELPVPLAFKPEVREEMEIERNLKRAVQPQEIKQIGDTLSNFLARIDPLKPRQDTPAHIARDILILNAVKDKVPEAKQEIARLTQDFGMRAVDIVALEAGSITRNIIGAKTRNEAISTLKKVLNVTDDVAKRYADDAVKATTDAQALKVIDDIAKATVKPPIPPDLQPLAQEARKYKSAEEFANSFSSEGINVKPDIPLGRIDAQLTSHIIAIQKKGTAEAYQQIFGRTLQSSGKMRGTLSAYEDRLQSFRNDIRKIMSPETPTIRDFYNQAVKGAKELPELPKAPTDLLRPMEFKGQQQIDLVRGDMAETNLFKQIEKKTVSKLPATTDEFDSLPSERQQSVFDKLPKKLQDEIMGLGKGADEVAQDLFKDIQQVGGIQSSQSFEFEEIPLHLRNNKTGVQPDELPDALRSMGYNFESGDEVLEAVLNTARKRNIIVRKSQPKGLTAGERLRKQMETDELRRKKIERAGIAKEERAKFIEQFKEKYDARVAKIKDDKEILKRRREFIKAVKKQFELSDADLKTITKRDIRLMSNFEFKQFLDDIRVKAEQIMDIRQAQNELKALLKERDFKKWENVRDVMKFPKSLDKMSVEQIQELEDVLSQFKKGDEFLPTRMMETIDNSRLAGVKTIREVLEFLAKDRGVAVESVESIKITEFHKLMGDHKLAREHPFFERLVLTKNKEFLEAQARVIELSDQTDDLIKQARKSQPRGLLERAIPTDKQIVKWLESNSDDRIAMVKEMTAEELEAARFMDETFREYYDYLVRRNAEKKFSRFEDQYFPHVRRNFFEAWKEDGVLQAFKEMRDKYAQDRKYLNILEDKTGDVLPYEKWIGFAQFRTDNLIPTANAARAFEAYVATLEKARHLDSLVSEMMAYVHALSPRKMTERGLELDDSLKRFTKEWINANKGRTPKGFFEPGGKMDWALRSSVALTRFLDLAFNFSTQFAAPIGEQAMNLTMLKPVAYATALKRRVTPQGRFILNKYENFVGRGFFKELSRAANTASDNLMSSLFAIFHGAVRKGNEIFLLGKMTDAEFKAGEISSERLAELFVEMNKYRAVRGTESIMGRTSEGITFKQYKTWAIPIVRATVTNIKDLTVLLRKEGVKKALQSDAGKELFYSIGIGTAVGAGTIGYYTELRDKRGRTFFEDMIYKGMRDAMSMIGAFDPTLWSKVRVADFYDDLSQALVDLMRLEEYKTTGELKGVTEFERTLTPRAIKQFLPKEKSTTGGKTPAGLPPLPPLPKLPALPPLPKLPAL